MSAEEFLGDQLKGYTSLNHDSEWASKRFHGWAQRATYATVSIDGKGLSKQEAEARFANLKNTIKDAHFSYIPTKKREAKKYEDSLMIFSRSSLKSEFYSDQMLFDFVISLFKIYNDNGAHFLKEKFVFKSKDKTLSDLYDSSGKDISSKGEFVIEGWDDEDSFEEEIDTEWFITSEPMDYSERHVRALKGELF